MLTAALCIVDKSADSIQVIFGGQMDDEDSVTRANISNILNDPRFDLDSFLNPFRYDFAILTLSEEVTFTPACLPANIGNNFVGQVANVNERYPNRLKEVNVTVTTNDDCLDTFKDRWKSPQIGE